MKSNFDTIIEIKGLKVKINNNPVSSTSFISEWGLISKNKQQVYNSSNISKQYLSEEEYPEEEYISLQEYFEWAVDTEGEDIWNVIMDKSYETLLDFGIDETISSLNLMTENHSLQYTFNSTPGLDLKSLCKKLIEKQKDHQQDIVMGQMSDDLYFSIKPTDDVTVTIDWSEILIEIVDSP
jgi:hypothetical protein